MNPAWPSLPILNQPSQNPAPRRSQAEKYGAAWYWGIGGLCVLTGVIVAFVVGVSLNWGLWKDIYILNDAKQPVLERFHAAERIAHVRDASPQQKWDLALTRVLPDRARYVLAESLDAAILDMDAESYAKAVARSEGWPNWLRLQLVRPLAYGAERHRLPKSELDTLRAHVDPFIALWADYAAAVSLSDESARARLLEARNDARLHEVATHLTMAYEAEQVERRRDELDAATRLLRRRHSESWAIWKGAQE